MSRADNPPPGECRQCWYHAYASKEAHKGLPWLGGECPACVDHMRHGCPDHMVVRR